MSRGVIVLFGTIGIALLLNGAFRTPLLVWNASASAPIGLYWLQQETAATGDLVLVHPPPQIAMLAAERHYLPLHVSLIKRLAAEHGETICARGRALYIDDHYRATRQDFDSAHRPMPYWTGCRKLGDDQVFLLNTDTPQSFDGRYFGPLPASTIAGVLSPVWTR